MKRICVFCGSHTGSSESYASMARDATEKIVRAGYGIVYGGGSIGLMGIVADTALACGGEVIGVIPHALARSEVAHAGLSELHVVKTMHERKAIMDDASDGFIALPGGFGTMDEFCEVLSWRQLRIHDKPIGLLNYRGYYDALLSLFDHMVREGFIGPHTRRLFTDADNVEELLSEMFEPRNEP
ncbi:MAG: TIGR00730 family Rossman fold protein [Candidatus Eremiobacteraeota bacterium]|nr:TIGR00730 family Rossman fold protein [Candidatus Eremiobacteraeota bacterium]MBV8498896.1 TIGR00730 family Rossman fold protein [Candidatus Eremiobacteraeota bacterium]